MIRRVRASRLISLLLLLQTRGQLTAAELAERLEVSERTIQRDADALAAAGVPVEAVRGPAGGDRRPRGPPTPPPRPAGRGGGGAVRGAGAGAGAGGGVGPRGG